MAFSGAGLASEAVEHFKAALAWREAHLHGNHPEIASSEARYAASAVYPPSVQPPECFGANGRETR